MSEEEFTSLLDELEAVFADECILVAQPPIAQVWASRR
jgi:hypothetical protein